jgi:UDP-N-acetylglucosamine 1-carboxyvinyltransferase
MAASILSGDVCTLYDCPDLSDVRYTINILKMLGCDVSFDDSILKIDSSAICEYEISEELMREMRSSIIFLGALAGKMGRARLCAPGGCELGNRPIDLHIKGLEKMGCTFEQDKNLLCARVNRLQGTDISLDFPSVGATENLILAAVKAKGKTRIFGAAKEPEIVHLCEFLNRCGAKINGAGTACIQVEGVLSLQACSYKIPADRIVAGTYLMCALATKGEIFLKNAPAGEMDSVLNVLQKMGAFIEVNNSGIFLKSENNLVAQMVKTGVYPGFPTDLQSPLLVLTCCAAGKGRIKETIYENRFHIVEELKKMNSSITVNGNEVNICGPEILTGTSVYARELRGNAALIMAGLVARGETEILNCSYVKRGYEDICRDLSGLGASLYENEDK